MTKQPRSFGARAALEQIVAGVGAHVRATAPLEDGIVAELDAVPRGKKARAKLIERIVAVGKGDGAVVYALEVGVPEHVGGSAPQKRARGRERLLLAVLRPDVDLSQFVVRMMLQGQMLDAIGRARPH